MTDETYSERRFARTIGIDYSGAETAESSLKGLRVYRADGDLAPEEVVPPTSSKKYWTRRGLADWLIALVSDGMPTIIGIDHGFSFPMRYFERHGLEPDWGHFLEDFCAHWPTDAPNTYVDFIRHGAVGAGTDRQGERRWRRLTEEAAGSAKSVFHFDVQGSPAKSTHAGIPWLRRIRAASPELHFWPFDGWSPPSGASVIAEVYPRLWSAAYPAEGRSPDQHDAYAVARWLQEADLDGSLQRALRPFESGPIATTARVEGWILGVEPSGPPKSSPRKPRPAMVPRSARETTRIGYLNRNGQEVIQRTDLPGNDHNQNVYVLRCRQCATEYGANGSDIFQRRCPNCGGGSKGLVTH